MAKRRGRGQRMTPGGGGMGGVLQQVQKLQDDITAVQEALGDETIEVTAGGGAITVVITGRQRVREVRIDPNVIDLEDKEWLTDLQDLIVAAVNQAIEQSQALAERRVKQAAGPLAGMMDNSPSGLLGG
jgi:DNA-binding YbaB/EbfC family protein